MLKNETDNNLSQDFRYEIKMVCREMSKPMVDSWIRSHPAGFRQTFPPRRINNIYFDSFTWNNLLHNLGGVSDRGKLRLRWYGENVIVFQGILEYKQKRNFLGRKLSKSMNTLIDLTSMKWTDVMRSIREEPLGSLAPFAALYPNPAIINHYDRKYYVSSDNLVRLTIDTNLTVFDQTLTRFPNVCRRESIPAIIVMELKADAAQDKRIGEIASGFPVRPAAFSKYVRGLVSE